MSENLNSICEFIVDTKHKTPKFVVEGIPCIRTPNIGRGYFILDNAKYVSEKTYKEWISRAQPSENDLILAREAPVGNVAIIPSGLKVCHGQRTVLMRPDVSKVFPKYLMYLLLGDEVQHIMRSTASGATVAHLNMSDIRALKLPKLPLRSTQEKIASILSTYDDLIENNNRRIAILEEMAQKLYREWFVKFCFPGHEEVKMVESELGLIPEGWEVVPFTQIADVLSGGTPKTKIDEYWNGDIPFFAPKDAPKEFYCITTEKSITEKGLNNCNSKLYSPGTVFITARGTVGKVVMPAKPMAMNQSCYALKGKENIGQYFLFLVTKKQVEYLKKNTGGSTFDTIVVDTFNRMKIVKPDIFVVKSFEKLVTPFFKSILNLMLKNQNLKKQRDLLLPKLISGKIEVS